MPKSLISTVEALAAKIPSRDAPTRYDLYDFQRSVEMLAESLSDIKSAEVAVDAGAIDAAADRITKEVDRLCDKVEELRGTIDDLAKVIAELSANFPTKEAK